MSVCIGKFVHDQTGRSTEINRLDGGRVEIITTNELGVVANRYSQDQAREIGQLLIKASVPTCQ